MYYAIGIGISLLVGVVCGYAFRGKIARDAARLHGIAENIIKKL